MKKTYISSTGIEITFPVNVAGKVKFISLNGPKNELTTSDELLQYAIEGNKRFKKGEITLLKGEPFAKPVTEENPPAKEVDVLPIDRKPAVETYTVPTTKAKAVEPVVTETVENADVPVTETVENADVPVTETEKEEEPATQSEHVYPEVKTMQDAANILMTKYGVKHQATRHPKAIQNKAAEHGVSFPNLML